MKTCCAKPVASDTKQRPQRTYPRKRSGSAFSCDYAFEGLAIFGRQFGVSARFQIQLVWKVAAYSRDISGTPRNIATEWPNVSPPVQIRFRSSRQNTTIKKLRCICELTAVFLLRCTCCRPGLRFVLVMSGNFKRRTEK